MKFYTMFLFIITISHLKSIDGKLVVVQSSMQKWFYLSQFRFHPTNGHLEVDLQVNNDTIRLYALEKQKWNEYKSDVNALCTQTSIQLTETANHSYHFMFSNSFTPTGSIYFLLLRCNSSLNDSSDVQISIKLLLTNGNDLFSRHFSADERGLFELFIVSTCLYILLLCYLIRFIHASKTISCLIIKLFLISMMSSWMNSLLNLIFFSIYGYTGSMESSSLLCLITFARFFHYFAQICFLLVLILCAKGYLITIVPLTQGDIIEITCFILLYIHIQIVLLIVNTATKNHILIHETVVIICESFQSIMYFSTGIWFLITLILTMKNIGTQINLLMIFLLWFLANTIIILLYLFGVFVDYQITLRRLLEVTIQYIAHMLLMLILNRKTFILRSRLNQIDIVHQESNSSSESQSKGISNTSNSNELTDLYALTHPRSLAPRWFIKSSDPPVRLEPRRDLTFITSMKTSSVAVRPSIEPLSHR